MGKPHKVKVNPADGADFVRAVCEIEQSPLSSAPRVPFGTVGHIEDQADGLYFVDFGEPYGVVACELNDLYKPQD